MYIVVTRVCVSVCLSVCPQPQNSVGLIDTMSSANLGKTGVLVTTVMWMLPCTCPRTPRRSPCPFRSFLRMDVNISYDLLQMVEGAGCST